MDTDHLNTAGSARFSSRWLALRESADHDARAESLISPLREHMLARSRGASGPILIRDLGCGTGSMCRWLATRLPGPQVWVLHDYDAKLLDHVTAAMSGAGVPRDAGGNPVVIHTRQADITRLRGTDFAETSLVTASAVLDLLTRAEMDDIVAGCVAAGCPALLTLSVVGRVDLDPAEPLDAEIMAAFNAHQQRTTAGRTLLGPDGVDAATSAFERHGMTVRTRASPWRLGPGQANLIGSWMHGWVAAAREQRPDLAPYAEDYLRRRLDACEAGALRVVVQHRDLLALPPPAAHACP